MSNVLITDENYWNEKYTQNNIGWDIGSISTPIKEYIDQIDDKSKKILIPGCGNAWEGEYLIKNGFTNSHLIDISSEAVSLFKKRVPSFPKDQIYYGDFFKHQEKYDLIIEQTFLSALHPSFRQKYVKQMHHLLEPKGKLVGLIFGVALFHDHPPYGGNMEEYRKLFEPYFHFKIFQTAHNSIQPRRNNEIFLILEKK